MFKNCIVLKGTYFRKVMNFAKEIKESDLAFYLIPLFLKLK